MNFDNILKLAEGEKYKEAEQQLDNILKDPSITEKDKSIANYLLGLVNVDWRNKDKNDLKAARCFNESIESNYPIKEAFIEYSVLEEDLIAINILRKGLRIFPDNDKLYLALLERTEEEDRSDIFCEIENKNILSVDILRYKIEHEFLLCIYSQCVESVKKCLGNFSFDGIDYFVLKMIQGFSLLLSEDNTGFYEAKDIFEKLIEQDLRNQLQYSHVMGIILFYIRINDNNRIRYYLSKIPVSYMMSDFDETPWYDGINVIFISIYRTIFDDLVNRFKGEKELVAKIKCLSSLYLFYPFEMTSEVRFTKADLTNLEKAISIFSKEIRIREVYIKMCIEKREFFRAYRAHIQMLSEYIDYNDYFDGSFIEESDSISFSRIVSDLLQKLTSQDNLFEESLCDTLLEPIIERLKKEDRYSEIVEISNKITHRNIKETSLLFNIAYAYGAIEDIKNAKLLYELIIRKSPEDSSVWNNLGIVYENEDLEYAKECYEKALKYSPKNENASQNLKRVITSLRLESKGYYSALASKITIEKMDEIGYDIQLVSCLSNVSDQNLSKMLKRDLLENAIAYVAGLHKTSLILSGSIMEAILIDILKYNNILVYDIQLDISSKVVKKKLEKMALADLLYVAEKEQLIKAEHLHLTQFLRGYRNLIHPSLEIRENSCVTSDNAKLVWEILKKLIKENLSK